MVPWGRHRRDGGAEQGGKHSKGWIGPSSGSAWAEPRRVGDHAIPPPPSRVSRNPRGTGAICVAKGGDSMQAEQRGALFPLELRVCVLEEGYKAVISPPSSLCNAV